MKRLLSVALLCLSGPAVQGALVDAAERFDAKRNYYRANYDESKIAPYTLEDPLTFADGAKVVQPRDWRERRAEILGIFASEMYGQEPPPPEALEVELLSERVSCAEKHGISGYDWTWLLDFADQALKPLVPLAGAIPPPSPPSRRYYIAHRGEYLTLQDGEGGEKVVNDAPEGTRPTYERVRDKNINAVKLDIQYTADKVVVMSHDATLKRTTGRDLAIKDSTYAQLKEAVFIKRGEFDAETIMTLDETLPIVKDVPLLWLDFKNFSDEMLHDVVAKLAKHGIPRERVAVATFNQEALKGIQRLYPEINRIEHISYRRRADGQWTLSGHAGTLPDFEAVKAAILVKKRELGLRGFNIPVWSETTTPEVIRYFKDHGCWIALWFVTSRANAELYRDSGADAYVTGMPSIIREHLEGSAPGRVQ